jgi:hypothetical protein
MLELEGKLSLKAEGELHQKETDLILKGIKEAVKAQIQVGFKGIKGLERVKFKLAAAAGSGGFKVVGTIEIQIPGS